MNPVADFMAQQGFAQWRLDTDAAFQRIAPDGCDDLDLFGLVLILKIVEIFIQLLVKRPVFRQVRNAGCSSSCNG